MPYIRNKTTIEDVRRDTPQSIWYSMTTCWWTHRVSDLLTHVGSGLPCDPRGGMLMRTDNVSGFLGTAEVFPGHYGEHGLDAFIAAHHDNCIVDRDDPRNTCLRTWDEYNELLDTQAAERAI